MIKSFLEFKIDENYNPAYHSKIDIEFIEDVYQYLFDLGFRLSEYEDTDDIDEDDATYGKSDFKEYVLSYGSYGFKTAKMKNISNNATAGSFPVLGLTFTKKFELGGSNEKAIKSFGDISDLYKEITGIISKLNKKNYDVDIKQTVQRGYLEFSFVIFDKSSKVKTTDINYRIAKAWDELSWSYSIVEEDTDDEDEDRIEFRKGNVGEYEFYVQDSNWNTVHRVFTDVEFESFRVKFLAEGGYRPTPNILTKHKLSCTITPNQNRRSVTIAFADATPVAAKKATKKAARKKKEYKDKSGTVLQIGDHIITDDEINAVILNLRGNKATIEDEDEDKYTIELTKIEKITDL